MEEQKWLVNQMLEHVSDHKRILFDQILENRTRHVTVVLENIFQPHNASAVLRSCDCFGVQDIHIIENGNKFENSEGVDMGASKWLTLHKYHQEENNTVSTLQALKKKGYKIVATTPHTKDCMIGELPVDEPFALVFGTELTGLSELAMKEADSFVRLPMYGFTESYNISVSVALSLYETTERLRKTEIDWHLTEQEKIDLKLNWVRQVIKHGAKIEKEILSRRNKS
jgi:tRNA (guanosine-2'-O-)-methyltransferase